MVKTYLDYNATAPMRPEIAAFIAPLMTQPGNASSVHGFGREARKHIEDARETMARLLNTRPVNIVFNSGATEGNNAVLNAYREKRVLVSSIEHSSVIGVLTQAEKIPVTPDGIVDMAALKTLIHTGNKPALISVMMVNSETGVIQPVKDIAALARECGAKIHMDAVQALGRMPVDINDLGVDYLTLSAHKFAGPQGVGCLIARDENNVPRGLVGGGQEMNRRAGTQNTAGIAGMGMAAGITAANMADNTRLQKLRDDMESAVQAICPAVTIYGRNAPRVANTSSIGLTGVDAQTQSIALDLDGVAVSWGSACSSGTFKPSHVLKAMGASDDDARSALRISMGYATTRADIDRFLSAWEKMFRKLSS
jgi:cysteine desulfurase